MKENNTTAPVLIPMQPEEFWGQIRLIIREELTRLENEPINDKAVTEVQGLTYKPLYKMGEVCRLFGVTRQTVYDWIEHGKLKPYKIRSRLYFLHNEIKELVPV